MMRLKLKVYGGGFDGKLFQMTGTVLRLGRSSLNDIPIADEELSRNHCLFEPVGDAGLRLTDLASANGTFVNGERLGEESRELKAGDEIVVGATHIVVEGDDPMPPPGVDANVDLGLGAESAPRPGPVAKAHRRKAANVLWAVCILLLMSAVGIIIFMPEGRQSAEVTESAQPEVPQLTEMSYEKVQGDSTSVFRYFLELSGEGDLHVVIDDLAGEGRHIDRKVRLSEDSRKRLQEILFEPSFLNLDREYSGPDTEPPALKCWQISFVSTVRSRTVRVVNAEEPDAFRRVREKLEAFSTNELNIRALEYSREQLVKMAADAADTGSIKWADRDVENGNVYAAVCAYREAIADLETVNPRPPEYDSYREALDIAVRELDTRCRNQGFVVEQATSVGDWEKARAELRTLCEMIPDRDDDRNRAAMVKLLDVERRIKKGGRR